ncbi:Nitrilase [Onygenales sp. PD_40]|nr:Nitrilase [Onygenales sp. PD_40]
MLSDNVTLSRQRENGYDFNNCRLSGSDWTQDATRPPKGLLSCPAEIRNEIYSHLLVLDQSMNASRGMNKPLASLLPLEILGTNKQIRDEALAILLRQNLWIRFQVGPMTVLEGDSYCIDEFMHGSRYSQPMISTTGALADKVRNTLGLDIKIIRRTEFVEGRRCEPAAEVRKDILFVYNKGRYEQLCHLVRRLGAGSISKIDLSFNFSGQQSQYFWDKELRFQLMRTLNFTCHLRSIMVIGEEPIEVDEDPLTVRDRSDLKRYNDELEGLLCRATLAVKNGLFNEARCCLNYIHDIEAIYSHFVLPSSLNDPAEEDRQKGLGRDLFITAAFIAVLDKTPKGQRETLGKFLDKLDSICGNVWHYYASGIISRRFIGVSFVSETRPFSPESDG